MPPNLLRPFSLGDFYDYEKHFTVMNYQEEAKLKQVGMTILPTHACASHGSFT